MTLNCNNNNEKTIHLIKKYEKKIFNEFIQKRTNLLKKIEQINYKNNRESLELINQLTTFITPMKFILQKDNLSDCTENQFLLFYLCFKDIFFLTTEHSSELSEESELSEDSESVSDSVSDSLSVSESVSE